MTAARSSGWVRGLFPCTQPARPPVRGLDGCRKKNAIDISCKVSKLTWCLTSTETIRLIRDGETGGGRGMEVGGEGDYIPIATLSPPECLLH